MPSLIKSSEILYQTMPDNAAEQEDGHAQESLHVYCIP
jgi:hypothetical protein